MEQYAEIIQNIIVTYTPMIAAIVTLICTTIKIISTTKKTIAEAASKTEVNELKKEVKNLKDISVAQTKENMELKVLLKKEIEAKTRIKE